MTSIVYKTADCLDQTTKYINYSYKSSLEILHITKLAPGLKAVKLFLEQSRMNLAYLTLHCLVPTGFHTIICNRSLQQMWSQGESFKAGNYVSFTQVLGKSEQNTETLFPELETAS